MQYLDIHPKVKKYNLKKIEVIHYNFIQGVEIRKVAGSETIYRTSLGKNIFGKSRQGKSLEIIFKFLCQPLEGVISIAN